MDLYSCALARMVAESELVGFGIEQSLVLISRQVAKPMIASNAEGGSSIAPHTKKNSDQIGHQEKETLIIGSCGAIQKIKPRIVIILVGTNTFRVHCCSFPVKAANPILIRSRKATMNKMKTNGMIRLRSLRIVLASIAAGATGGIVVMTDAGHHHRQWRDWTTGIPHPVTDRHSVASEERRDHNPRFLPVISTCETGKRRVEELFDTI